MHHSRLSIAARSAIERLTRSGGGLVLIIGGTGVGKTTAVFETARHLSSSESVDTVAAIDEVHTEVSARLVFNFLHTSRGVMLASLHCTGVKNAVARLLMFAGLSDAEDYDEVFAQVEMRCVVVELARSGGEYVCEHIEPDPSKRPAPKFAKH